MPVPTYFARPSTSRYSATYSNYAVYVIEVQETGRPRTHEKLTVRIALYLMR